MLCYASHDRRDIGPDVDDALKMVRDVASGYPDVPWQFANGLQAARAVCDVPRVPAPQFEVRHESGTFHITSDQPLFGPHPFLAVEEEGDVFFRDNPTVEGQTSWAYTPVRPSKVRRIGVAGSNTSGEVGTLVVDV